MATTAHAQPRHHARDADPDADAEEDTDAGAAKAKAKRAKAKAADQDAEADPDADSDTAKGKGKGKTKAKTKTKAKAKTRAKDPEPDPDADAAAEAERDRDRAREKEKEKEKEKERAKAEADADAAAQKAKGKAVETEAQATSGGGGSGGEAYHSGTLGFSVPITVIGAATGGGGGGLVPAVDIVYFLDDKAALDLIVGLAIHRQHAVGAMGASSDNNVIGGSAGLGYRMYSVKNNLLSFLEPQAVISWPDTSSTDSITLSLGGSFGLERSVTPWFSVSAAVGVSLNFASTFKDIQLATAANLAANLYWR